MLGCLCGWCVLSVLCVLSVSGCNLSALWGLDAPRPALASNDVFKVDPACPDLIIDRSGLAQVPRIVTLSGRRHGTGLGAEAVPITVRLGACEGGGRDTSNKDTSNKDASNKDAGPVSTASGATIKDAGSTSDAGLGTNSAAANACHSGATLDNTLTEQVELIEHQDGGCHRRSPALLECTLNARGEATFEVQGHFPNGELSLGGFAPFCVTPLEVGDQHAHRTEEYIVPRFGASQLAVAVLQLSNSTATTAATADAGCDTLFSCATARARATFRAGVVSADIPTGDLRVSDLLPVVRDVDLTVDISSLDTLPQTASAFLSKTPCNEAPDAGPMAGDSSFSLPIRSRQSGTDTFYLCASGFAASYQVTANLTGAPTAATDGGSDTTSAPSADAPVALPSTVVLTALPEGYVAEPAVGGLIVNTLLCGGSRVHTDPHSLQVSGATPIGPDDQLVLACAAPKLADDAGTSPAGSAGQSTDAATACGQITLTPNTGGTCRLDAPQH